MGPWHVRVLHALKDADRAVKRDGRVEDLPLAAILDERAGDDIGRVIV